MTSVISQRLQVEPEAGRTAPAEPLRHPQRAQRRQTSSGRGSTANGERHQISRGCTIWPAIRICSVVPATRPVRQERRAASPWHRLSASSVHLGAIVPMTISTRRFWARPSGVVLARPGWSGRARRRGRGPPGSSPGTAARASSSPRRPALPRASCWRRALPALSVWPWTSTAVPLGDQQVAQQLIEICLRAGEKSPCRVSKLMCHGLAADHRFTVLRRCRTSAARLRSWAPRAASPPGCTRCRESRSTAGSFGTRSGYCETTMSPKTV